MVIVVIYRFEVFFMAYFLKKATLKGRTYLSIVESFYSHEKKGTAHKTFKSLGSVETLIANGIQDPIAFYQEEVDKLNNERKTTTIHKISDIPPIKHLGYFPLKSILEKLDIKKFLDLYKLVTNFDFDLYSMLSALVYARCVNPCSKLRTFHEVLPVLYDECNCSYDQILTAVEFFGDNYEKFVELFTNQIKQKYSINTTKTYFDCTNFYFEIDREDDFRRKGPSKENRKDPIIGLGLLLDSNQIPIGMKLYPGNESEKPILRNIISDMKNKNNIKGKTIHVADKGLNCIQNITASILNGDGYLFSKSVKMLPETEKTWIKLDNDWITVKDNDGKTLYRYKSCVDDFEYIVTDSNNKKKKVMLKEKRLVTYNPTLAKKQRREINKMIEKAKSLCYSQAKKEEYGESSKYMSFVSIDENGEVGNNKIAATLNKAAIEKDLNLAGYNLLITSETSMSDQEMYDTYHNLWRIEESFRIMKSDLDARPVFLQKEESIKGHFLICYIAVLLERIFQFHVLKNKYNSSEIIKFIKDFKVVKADNKFINISFNSEFINELSETYNLPLTHYLLSETQIKKVMNHKF